MLRGPRNGQRLTDPRLTKNSSLCPEPGIRLRVSLRRTGLKELGVNQHRTPETSGLRCIATGGTGGQLSNGLLTQVKNKKPIWEARCRAKRPLFSRSSDWLSTTVLLSGMEGWQWQVIDRVS